MNNELTKLFDGLPEGIVLFNNESRKVTLANQEFKRLFKVQGKNESLQVEDLLRKKNLKEF